jgi:4-hydroxy-2-oxoheptanedioate aldolase
MSRPSNGPLRYAGRPLLALILKMPAAALVEMAGHAGFDFVLLDTEHGPSDMTELENHVRAADCAGIRVLVRVSDAGSPDVLRALDAGAAGIVVPHVAGPDDVALAAAATRYPPRGRRSLALSTRAGRQGTRSVSDHLAAASETILIGQIEDAESLDRVPEILTSDGLTGVFIGPADLSASMGWPGELDHPRVSEAIEQIVAATNRVPALSLGVLAGSGEEVREWADRGVGMIFVNSAALLVDQLRATVAAARPDLSEELL